MKHLFFESLSLTVTLIKTGNGTMSGGQFDWGGPLQKSNGGVLRYTYPVRKSGFKRKGIKCA